VPKLWVMCKTLQTPERRENFRPGAVTPTARPECSQFASVYLLQHLSHSGRSEGCVYLRDLWPTVAELKN